MLFKLGQVVATPGAIQSMKENGIEAWSLLQRHANGDWGCVPEEDKLENQRSVEEGYRVMSSYVINDCGDKLWVITGSGSVINVFTVAGRVLKCITLGRL